MTENGPEKFQEKIRTSQLLGIYGGLLSDKQGEILQMYCDEDLGFSEIAEELGVTRQAVYDATRQGRATLEKYEEHLHLLEQQLEKPEILAEMQQQTSSDAPGQETREVFEAIEKTASEDIIYDTVRLRQQLKQLKTLLWPAEADTE